MADLERKQTPPKIFRNLGISTAIVPPESAEALAVEHTTVSLPLVPQNGEEPEALGANATKSKTHKDPLKIYCLCLCIDSCFCVCNKSLFIQK